MIEGGKPFAEARPGISEKDAAGDPADARLQGPAERGRGLRRGAGENHGLNRRPSLRAKRQQSRLSGATKHRSRLRFRLWHRRMTASRPALLAMTKPKNGGNIMSQAKRVVLVSRPVGEPKASDFRIEDYALAGARRGPGPAAHHLAVARSLYARADERRPVLCGAGADRRRDGGRHGVRGDRLEQSGLCQGRHRAVARGLADPCAFRRQGAAQGRSEARRRFRPRWACSACPA